MATQIASVPAHTRHPYITMEPSIADGKAIIQGTRIRVAQIAIEYERLGWTPDQIIDAHPHLNLAQVHDALSYYYENQALIDTEIAAGEQFISQLQQQYPSKFDTLIVLPITLLSKP